MANRFGASPWFIDTAPSTLLIYDRQLEWVVLEYQGYTPKATDSDTRGLAEATNVDGKLLTFLAGDANGSVIRSKPLARVQGLQLKVPSGFVLVHYR